MICIECSQPVKSLYTQYSSRNIKLTACPKCNRFADKYIEHDYVVVFIDLILIKPQIYRHLIFNKLLSDDGSFHPAVYRMITLITLFDVYLTWAGVEMQLPTAESVFLLQLPVMTQYMYFLALCLIDLIVGHLVIRTLARIWLDWRRPNALSIALMISSTTKLFPILTIIWSYDVPIVAQTIGWSNYANMVEAIRIVLDCGYPKALAMMLASWIAKTFLIRALVLRFVMRGTGLSVPIFNFGIGWQQIMNAGGNLLTRRHII